MSQGPLITCIIPSFNSRQFICEALESVFSQSYRPIEVIVADDGSSDDTPEMVRRRFPEVAVVQQPTRGPASTRNLGIIRSVGEFIAFLDADDLWDPEKLTRQYESFLEDPEIEYCISLVQMFWSEDMHYEGSGFSTHRRAQPIPGYATPALLARRTAFEKVGLFDEELSFSDAIDWFMRAAGIELKMKVVPEVLTYHRLHNSNLSRRQSESSRQEFLGLVRRKLRMERDRQGLSG